MAKITIKDVAEHAGVSTATVSYVINNTKYVTKETKQKVLLSINELDYKPNLAARSLKQGKRNLIGFVVPDLTNVFYANIIEEVEKAILPYDYRIVISQTKEKEKREIDSISALTSGIVDGIIITSTVTSYKKLETVIPKNFPTVFIDRLLDDSSQDTILVDTYQSVKKGVQKLLDDGHQRIGMITGIPHISTSLDRLNGYKDALKENQIEINPALIKFADSMRHSAVPHAKNLLENGCTALVVSNGIMTVDVIQFFQDNNIPIGQKGGIDLLGFNDFGGINHTLYYIHSIDQPTSIVGKAAAEQIINRIKNPDMATRKIIFESELLLKHEAKQTLFSPELKWTSILK